MRLLVVAATHPELAALVPDFGPATPLDSRTSRYPHRGREIDVLITGVGMVATAVWVSRALALTSYDAAFNFGLCGTFDRAVPLGSVVHVVSDGFPELGAEDGEAFLSMETLGFLDANAFPFASGALRGRPPAWAALSRWPEVRGVTVNTVHGHAPSIATLVARHDPQVESMEGAAFLYAALAGGVPCAQVRAVSNVVERRNRAAWNIGAAVRELAAAARDILEG